MKKKSLIDAEVVQSSLNYIKNHPKASIKESLNYALTEWDL